MINVLLKSDLIIILLNKNEFKTIKCVSHIYQMYIPCPIYFIIIYITYLSRLSFFPI